MNDTQKFQYDLVKVSYPQTLVFFRQGDNLVALGHDAGTAAGILGLKTTTEGKDVALVIPYDGAYQAIEPLLEAGQRVTVIEEVKEVPHEGLVERHVIYPAELPEG